MSELSDQDLKDIKELHDTWIAEELEANLSGVIDLCTSDVRFLPPDAPPSVGKEEIAKHLTSQEAKLLTADVTDVSIHGSGSVAYLISNYSTRYVTKGHSEIAHEAKGTHLWILRKEGDQWRVAVVTWNSW